MLPRMHPRVRAVAQRLAARVAEVNDRLLEIRTGDPLAAQFASFGRGSRISYPRPLITHPETISIGNEVNIMAGVVLEAVHGHGILMDIGDNVTLGYRVRLVAVNGVKLGNRVGIGHGVTLADTVHDYKNIEPGQPYWLAPLRTGRSLVVEDDVWIGNGTVVAGGITLGRGCIIGPNSNITRDVEPYTLVGGNPPQALRRRTPDGTWVDLETEAG